MRALSAGDSRAVCSPWPMPGTGKKRSALAIWSHTSANDCSAADSSCTAQRSVIFRNRHHCSACLLSCGGACKPEKESMQTYGWLPADEVLALAQIRMALQGMHSQEWPCLRNMFLIIL